MSLQSEPSLPRPRKQLFTAAQARTGVSAARANFLISHPPTPPWNGESEKLHNRYATHSGLFRLRVLHMGGVKCSDMHLPPV